MNTQIVKTYTLKELSEYVPNYKFLKIEDLNGRVICSWNQPAKKISEHYKECLKRINSAIISEGFYNVYCCNSLKNQKNADTFIIQKGEPAQEQSANLSEHLKMNLPGNKNDLISVSQALAYITEIANLKVTVGTQEAEIKRLKDEITVLEAELSELDRENLSGEGLKEGGATNDIVSYLKESAPALMGLADRFFSHQDKKLELERLKLEKQNKPKLVKKIIVNKKPMYETGSPEHIEHIKNLAENGTEEQLNNELDKLEMYNPELCRNLCEQLNLIEDENDNQEQN